MKLEKSIDLSKNCHSISYFEGHIFACCSDCDGSGTEIHCLTKDGELQRVFSLKNSLYESSEIPFINYSCLGLNKD